jgi:hypothetical protein
MEATAPDIIRRLADGRAAARLPTILPVRPNWVTLAAASLLTGGGANTGLDHRSSMPLVCAFARLWGCQCICHNPVGPWGKPGNSGLIAAHGTQDVTQF